MTVVHLRSDLWPIIEFDFLDLSSISVSKPEEDVVSDSWIEHLGDMFALLSTISELGTDL